MRRALVLLNPNAGRGRAEGLFARAAEGVAGKVDLRTVLCTDPDEAFERAVAGLAEGTVDRLIAVGGDGSGNLAATALMESGKAGEVAFGLVPAGTGSDFVRHLDPGTRPVDRLERLLSTETTRPCDLIEVNLASGGRRYSLNVASAGLSSAVAERINRDSRRAGGSYLLLTVGALLTYRPYRCRVEIDGRELFDNPLFLVAIANGPFFGKAMKVAPEARIDDGLLDVIVVPPMARWKMPWRLPQFLKGRHLKYPEVIFQRAREVRLEPDRELPSLDLDGDSIPAETVSCRVLQGALKLLC